MPQTLPFPDVQPAWYIVSERWLLQWRTFAGYTPSSGKPWTAALPPGPINNAILLDGAGRPHLNLEKKTDYRAVVSRVSVRHKLCTSGLVCEA